MDNFEDFAKKAKLDDNQKKLVKQYIVDLLIDNLNSMKEEYLSEIDGVINSLGEGTAQ